MATHDDKYLGECPLCGRPIINGPSVSEHHPVPKSYGGKEKVLMHHICHQKVHTVFTEKELYESYYDFQKLKKHPQIRKFIKWVKKQDPEFLDKNRTSERLKKRRRFARRKKRR